MAVLLAIALVALVLAACALGKANANDNAAQQRAAHDTSMRLLLGRRITSLEDAARKLGAKHDTLSNGFDELARALRTCPDDDVVDKLIRELEAIDSARVEERARLARLRKVISRR